MNPIPTLPLRKGKDGREAARKELNLGAGEKPHVSEGEICTCPTCHCDKPCSGEEAIYPLSGPY